MSNSIEDMFNTALSSGENNNEGAEAAKYINDGAEVVSKQSNSREKLNKLKKSLFEYIETKIEESITLVTGTINFETNVQSSFKELGSEAFEQFTTSIGSYLDESDDNEDVNELEEILKSSIDDGVKDLVELLTSNVDEARKEYEEEQAILAKQKEAIQKKKDEERKRNLEPVVKEKEIVRPNRVEPKSNDNYTLSIRDVTLVVEVLDLYRGYDLATQESINLFFNEQKEETVITSIINEKVNTQRALSTLIEAQEKEQVDRAFFLMSLGEGSLNHIGRIVTTYTNSEPFDRNAGGSNKIECCRRRESLINDMSNTQQTHLRSISELLQIVHG